MRNFAKRIGALLGALVFLVMSMPLKAFAADPITDTMIINAWAEAIAAYGAANGVSMDFDVSSTDQIGSGVKELWDDFVDDAQDVNVMPFDDAASIFWRVGFKRMGDAVGVDLTMELTEQLDGFWNWLLSGPAEMVKVDNAFVWSMENGEVVTPVVLRTIGAVALPYLPSGNADADTYSRSLQICNGYNNNPFVAYKKIVDPVYVSFFVNNSGGISLGVISSIQNAKAFYFRGNGYGGYGWSGNVSATTAYGNGMYTGGTYSSAFSEPYNLPVFDSLDAFMAVVTGNSGGSSIALSPYGDTPGPISIPDNEDVNYAPLPVGIPLDIPWDTTKYGDGETLTDEDKGEIAEDIGGVIEEDGSLTLEDENVDDPTDDPTNPGEEVGEPGDYVVPGLAEVFPFCIPFDIYNFLSALAATPEAPHFSATLAFPQALGGSQSIDLDFDTTTFNAIAQILRTMELLAFIIGLALLTRSMFIRG